MFSVVSEPLLSIPAQAVVNHANVGLQYASGLCGTIFDRAGKLKLQRACCAIGVCAVGEAVVTDGYDLSAKYIIHAVPPRWCGGKHGEDRLLEDCYRNCMKIARRLGVKSVAFPLLSEGCCNYPYGRGLAVAKKVLSAPENDDVQIYLTLSALADAV